MKKNSKLSWYAFHQNNSGGRWHRDGRVSVDVYIQAHSAKEANGIAEDLGIYFDGVKDGYDCDCCGDRWYPVDGDGDEEPLKYGEPVDVNSPDVRIHPYDNSR